MKTLSFLSQISKRRPDGGRASSSSSGDMKDLASEILRQWPDDVAFSAQAVLAEHPELQNCKSIVLDLAYEEYCRTTETSDEELDPHEFVGRFPRFQRSLLRLLELHDLCDGNVQFLARMKASWPQPGETFLGFTLIEELGRGALSRVFLATEPEVGNRSVVVKICMNGHGEAQTLGPLQHPNIVPVFSVRCDDQSGYMAICMPFVSRATLFDVLDHGFENSHLPTRASVIEEAIHQVNAFGSMPLHPDRADASTRGRGRRSYVDAVVQLGVQLADALAYTHRRDICHSDIKPSNVLLDADGNAMLFDFNLACVKQVNESNVGGTIPYMAPEQLLAVSQPDANVTVDIDPRTDLFSLGVTL